MKQFDPIEKVIGDTTFYIRPMPAFAAARISGELAAVTLPLLSVILPFLKSGDDVSPLDVDVGELAPAISGAFSTLSGEKLEKLMKALLTDGGYIAYENDDTRSPKKLLEDDANELFCGRAQDMFVLAFYSIGVNFGDFFDKLATRSGLATEGLAGKIIQKNMENLTSRISTTSN